MNSSARDRIVVAGIADLVSGEAGGLDPLSLMTAVSKQALADASLQASDVDGLFTSTAQVLLPTLRLAEELGIQPRYLDGTVHGGVSSLSHVHHAVGAIRSGLCDVALVAYGSTQRSELKRTGRRPAVATPPPMEEPYGPMYPPSSYALMAQRHMAVYGTTREQLADVAVAASQWAALNPRALRQRPLTRDEVAASPMVSSPLRVLDCCLITDGGGALVVTTAERAAKAGRASPVVAGSAEVTTHYGVTKMHDLADSGASASATKGFEAAGLGPPDMDVIEVYDAFTINTILLLEDLGFCIKGEGGRLVSDGGIAPGGDLAVNTNGGGLSYCHPGMFGMFTVTEAVRQLRHECGDRQVSGAKHAVAHGVGGTMSTHATLVLSV